MARSNFETEQKNKMKEVSYASAFHLFFSNDIKKCYAFWCRRNHWLDLSDWCKQGRKIDIYLTSGAGRSDARVSMIASEGHLNCTLTFKVKSENFVMLVLELPDQTPQERVCFSQSNNSVVLRDYDEKHECQEDGKKAIYYGSSQNSMSVLVSSRGLMSTVKLTSTSMRDSKQLMCSEPDEIICVYKYKVYCMTSKALCDKNINCAAEFDESDEKCKEVAMTFVMIICTFLTSILSVTLIASAVYTAIPTRKEIFIHAYDQTLSLFDCDDIVQSEIHLQELLPLGDEDNLNKK